jgi:phenylpyruvate tautomerase PptA (4-oxalocrotonate tautomerase family)
MASAEGQTVPWITVTLARQQADPRALADELAREVAAAAGLLPDDVVVLVSVAEAAAGRGSVVTFTGRPRPADTEKAIVSAVRRVVAEISHDPPELVAVIRL